jgi:predicted phosphodiesterase
MLGAAVAIGLFARQDARIGPLTVRLAGRPSLRPASTLVIPPFGSVSAATHQGPLAFRATLDEVDVPALEGLIRRYANRGDQSQQALQAALAPFERRARAVTVQFLLRLVAIGLAGAAATSLLGRRTLAQAQVLHVSDLHLNPAGFDLAVRLADQFQVDAVVDTGDMGTWGLPFERSVPQQIRRFSVPYLFVKGNHDSDKMVAAVAAAGGDVLDHKVATVRGVRFYGVADPTFSPGQGYRTAALEALKRRRSVTVAAELDALSVPADVLLVHDPALATYAMGHVPTVLDGHLHRFDTGVDHGTRELNDATTGAAGPDGLRRAHPPPYGAEVVYFDAGTRRPVAVDRITVRSLQAEFSVQRLRLPEGATAFTPNPVGIPAGDAPRPGDQTTVTELPAATAGS